MLRHDAGRIDIHAVELRSRMEIAVPHVETTAILNADLQQVYRLIPEAGEMPLVDRDVVMPPMHLVWPRALVDLNQVRAAHHCSDSQAYLVHIGATTRSVQN